MTLVNSKNKYITLINYPHKDSWDKTRNFVEFDINNVHYTLTNSIRRCIISSVKSVGFRTEPAKKCQLNVIVNDTPIHNQMLIHRMAMIPINYKKVESYDEDEFSYEINEINDTNVIKDITTEHIRVKRLSNNTYLSEEDCRKLFPPDPITGDYLLITKLRPKYYTPIKYNQELINTINSNYEKKVEESMKLHIEGRAVVSSGKENGHFSPSCASFYINRIDPEKSKIAEDEYVLKQVEFCKQNDLTLPSEEKLRNKFNVSERGLHFYTNEKGEPDKFKFTIESVGVIPPLVIFHQGISILINKINLFLSNLINKNRSLIQVNESLQLNDGYDIVVMDEDDTLGGIIQSYLSNNYCDYSLEPEERKLDFVGYKKPHPLENYIIITVQSVGNNLENIISEVISPGCKNIVKILNNISHELENTKQFTDEMKMIANHKF